MKKCPNANDLGAFAEGRLQGKDRLLMLSHLNSCPDCKSEYVELLRFLGKSSSEEESGDVIAFTPKTRHNQALWAGLGLAASILFAVWFWAPISQDTTPAWSTPQWWVANYGEDINTERRNRAQRIFERLKASAGDLKAELYMVGSTQEPIVLALEQGVVISKEALEMCFQSVDSSLGDARLALVLGHELEHLRSGETGHAFAAAQKFQGLSAIPEVKPSQETQADQWGMVYAAQAGFDPHLMLEDSLNFLALWRSQSGIDHHPQARERAEALHGRLSEVARELDNFQFGNRLYQMGQYENAAVLLKRFNQKFSSRETLNNLGLVEVGLATKQLAACDVQLVVRFKLPFVLDNQTILQGIRRRGGHNRSPCYDHPSFTHHINQAIGYFEAALKRDPDYHPARKNLIATHLLAADGTAALAMSQSNLTTAEDAIVGALSLYLSSLDQANPGDDQGEALSMLSSFPNDKDVLYNQASILAETGGNPRFAFEQFLQLESYGPFADRAREFLGLKTSQLNQLPEFEPLEITTGPVSEDSAKLLGTMTSRELKIGPNLVFTIYQNSMLSVLTQGDQVILVEKQKTTGLSDLTSQLNQSQPMETTTGNVYVGHNWMIETLGEDTFKDVRFLPKLPIQ